MAIIVTDGQSNNPPLTAAEAKKARDKGITVLALGVGSGIGRQELNAMATDPDSTHVYTADNFDALNSLQALLSDKACEGKYLCSSFTEIRTCVLKFYQIDKISTKTCVLRIQYHPPVGIILRNKRYIPRPFLQGYKA